jgi:hypothetical protein
MHLMKLVIFRILRSVPFHLRYASVEHERDKMSIKKKGIDTKTLIFNLLQDSIQAKDQALSFTLPKASAFNMNLGSDLVGSRLVRSRYQPKRFMMGIFRVSTNSMRVPSGSSM